MDGRPLNKEVQVSTTTPTALFAESSLNITQQIQAFSLEIAPGQNRLGSQENTMPPQIDTITFGDRSSNIPVYTTGNESVDDESAIAHSLSDDPKLLAQLNFVLQFLRKHSPELAKTFLKSLRAGIEGPAESGSPTNNQTVQSMGSSNNTASSITATSLNIEIEFSSRTEINTAADGTEVSLQKVESARISISFTSVSLSASSQNRKADPIVLDLDGNGIKATGIQDGKLFDINADGKMDLTSFILGKDGLLALDRNRNGKIDNGSELFGDQHGALNGFEELRKLDKNEDGVVDAGDSGFADLGVLMIKQGHPDEMQLTSLAQAGVAALRLAYQNTDEAVNPDATIAQKGTFIRANGTEGLAADLLLAYRKVQQ
jgi:hypothetical protein